MANFSDFSAASSTQGANNHATLSTTKKIEEVVDNLMPSGSTMSPSTSSPGSNFSTPWVAPNHSLLMESLRNLTFANNLHTNRTFHNIVSCASSGNRPSKLCFDFDDSCTGAKQEMVISEHLEKTASSLLEDQKSLDYSIKNANAFNHQEHIRKLSSSLFQGFEADSPTVYARSLLKPWSSPRFETQTPPRCRRFSRARISSPISALSSPKSKLNQSCGLHHLVRSASHSEAMSLTPKRRLSQVAWVDVRHHKRPSTSSNSENGSSSNELVAVSGIETPVATIVPPTAMSSIASAYTPSLECTPLSSKLLPNSQPCKLQRTPDRVKISADTQNCKMQSLIPQIGVQNTSSQLTDESSLSFNATRTHNNHYFLEWTQPLPQDEADSTATQPFLLDDEDASFLRSRARSLITPSSPKCLASTSPNRASTVDAHTVSSRDLSFDSPDGRSFSAIKPVRTPYAVSVDVSSISAATDADDVPGEAFPEESFLSPTSSSSRLMQFPSSTVIESSTSSRSTCANTSTSTDAGQLSWRFAVSAKSHGHQSHPHHHPRLPATPVRARPLTLERTNSLFEDKMLVDFIAQHRDDAIASFVDDFTDIKLAGEGESFEVFKARERSSGLLYAVKRSRRMLKGRADRQSYLKEVELVHWVGPHEHIVKHYRAWQEEAHFFIQLEYCPINLEEFVRLYRQMGHDVDDAFVVDTAQQITRGLHHIHSHDVVHLDIKPANVLLSAFEGGTLKLGDFGQARRRTDFVGHNSMIDGAEGDSQYMAPELLLAGVAPCDKADIFSLGMLLLRVVTDIELPRSGETWHRLRDGHAADFLRGHCGADVETMILSLLEPDPTDRPSAEQVLFTLGQLASKAPGRIRSRRNSASHIIYNLCNPSEIGTG